MKQDLQSKFDEKRRVLILSDTLSNGGAERQLALLAQNLPSSWEPCVWSISGGPFFDVLLEAGVPVRLSKRQFRFDISPFFELGRFMRTWSPHIVHSWGWMSSAAAGPICRIMGIPLIDGTIRMGRLPPRRALANKLSMRWANIVIANSQAGLDAWDIDSKRGSVVYNGFDPARLGLCIGDSSNQPFTVIMTGRMVAEKDYRTFFSAARELIKSDSVYRFVAVGDGPDRRKLITETADLAEMGVVAFPEPTLEVLGLVHRANVGVLLSNPALHAEGCSNTIMEYMACGLPVICNAGGGNHELVNDQETGFVIPPSDPRALADKLLWLQGRSAEAEKMGRAGREKLLKDLTVESMVSKTISVYQDALSKRTQ